MKRKFFKKISPWLALVLVAAFCFSFTSFYNFHNQRDNFIKWSSPDETANYFFTKLFTQTGSLNYFGDDADSLSNLIHPRSVKNEDGVLKPVSFLGIILIFGRLAMVFGVKALPYFTPALAALGVIFFYFLVKRWANGRVALISAALLSVFPVYTYYAARSFFHNVPFLVFVVIGLFFWTLMVQGSKKYDDCPTEGDRTRRLLEKLLASALAGFFIGLATITRTAEILWLLPLLFVASIIYRRRLDGFKIIICLLFFVIALLPALFWNRVLYGGIFQSGYREMNSSVAQVLAIKENGNFSISQAAVKVKDAIFYFGVKPKQSLLMFKRYGLDMFPYLFYPAALGLVLLCLAKRKKESYRPFAYLILWLSASALLILYYGSWKFSDNPDPARFTIGNSYTRYWLPIYLGAIPLAAYAIDRLSHFFFRTKKYLANLLALALVLIFFWLSVIFVLFGSEEGLWYSGYNFDQDRGIFQNVIKETERNAVIITRYQDKLFFPERRVIVGLLDDQNMNKIYAGLAKSVPVYYFHFRFQAKDLIYLNSSKLKPLGVKLVEVNVPAYNLALYRLERVK